MGRARRLSSIVKVCHASGWKNGTVPAIPAMPDRAALGRIFGAAAGAPTLRPDPPAGLHRGRVPDRLVVEHVLGTLVPGSGDERLASRGRSGRTTRRHAQAWARLGLAEVVHPLALRAYDRMSGLDLEDVAEDRCLTKAPGGGEVAGRSPVDRGTRGLKRSLATEETGIALHVVSAGANRHDAPLRAPTLAGQAHHQAPQEDQLPGAPSGLPQTPTFPEP